MRIEGMTAVVTGAGSGLGLATAKRLAAQGAKLAVLDLSPQAAEAAAREVGGLGLAADVSDVTALEAAFARIEDRLGPPRIVVSCAGIGTAARILPRDGSLTVDSFARTLQVNLTGTYAVMNLAARAMAAADPVEGDEDGARGVIVNTASVAFEDGQIGQAAYAASKGGVASMTLPAARELARFGIRVMAIAPGLFETAMSAGLPEDIRAEILKSVPYPSRMGQPDEYARLVQAIVENPMLNGTVIRLDAATRMPIK
ncbi:SDR family NAD(P)-dependent oxidoreductase [Celeribacter indicus]|uniref:Short-chain dehydrogenase/reductase SDR n=1 Tax=Celeribacter indicus TaxID=1208324 RepID=A0A0B5E173_9RHOB|nr:SDR family NAD(P)-dependent oxidoreductase [Celeribacter indicus]AJE46177.1 short-chain dehydrogenase/reductase SDR [Celeribacter indicus]SDW49128.1 NAD(P)-dependent dehydrogenase, short-chain alcohol dehydrogenase family [Celeribacter indicus]